jgi:hypothetical protein
MARFGPRVVLLSPAISLPLQLGYTMKDTVKRWMAGAQFMESDKVQSDLSHQLETLAHQTSNNSSTDHRPVSMCWS